MADGLVTGEAKAAINVAGGADDAFFGLDVQEGSKGCAVPLSLSNSGAPGRISLRLPERLEDLPGQRLGAGDGEGGFGLGFGVLWLGAAESQRVFALKDGAVAFFVYA